MPHTPQTVPVYLTPSVRNWHGSMEDHWENAIGFWNDALDTTIFADLASDGALTRVWVVRDGSPAEQDVNNLIVALGSSWVGGPTCAGSDWANVYPAFQHNAGGHQHYRYQKVCIYDEVMSYNDDNPQGYHFWWLTFMHELGHVISLYHPADGCLMLSGQSMRYPCSSEIEFVNEHYGL